MSKNPVAKHAWKFNRAKVIKHTKKEVKHVTSDQLKKELDDI
jgi:hypothetical protein